MSGAEIVQGNVPVSSDWETVTIGQCLDTTTRYRRTATVQTSEYKASGRFPVVDQGARPIAGWTDDEHRVISDGLPLVVFGDHTRALKFVDFPFARGADGTQLLRTRRTIDPRFFYYAARSVDLPSRGYNRHFTMLRELEINVPSSLDEQRSIARVLRRVEEAIALENRVEDIAEELYRGSLGALFSRGNRGEELMETEIGEIPLTWQPRKLRDLCEIWSGGTPRKAVAEFWDGDIPWVSGKDLKLPVLDEVTDHVSRAGIDSGSRLAPADAVLVLVRGMGLAKDLPVANISRPMAFNQDIKALVLRDEYVEYPGHFLRSAIYASKERLLSQIVSSAHGTMTLNLSDVENLSIPFPSDPAEAKEVAATLRALEQKIALHRSKSALLTELLSVLTYRLMTREISISELDLRAVHDVDDQSAEDV